MKKTIISPFLTHLLRAAFLLVLFALAIQVLPSVLAQRMSKDTLKAAARQKVIGDNDAGIVTLAPGKIGTPEDTCANFTFSVVAGDPTVSTRPFRDGIVKTCVAPGGPCQAGVTGTFHYQVFQFTSPATQCVTVTYTATNANFSFVTVFNAPPVLTNLCTNWVTDSGNSGTNGVPIVFSFNALAGTTYYFFVNDVGTLPANGTIQIDAATCTSNNVTICHKRNTTLMLPPASSELVRHLDHGDTIGQCTTAAR